ncbi:MAG TPA: class II aldolase/adducin family protein [Dehalococcoidales bacterium]|nr:class II aldolase/adducin family protein [Dehalococcoidales bacterium]
MFINQFQNVGRALFSRGLVSSSSGNLSIRMGEHLIITRRGSNLATLEEIDLVETGIHKNDRNTPLASVELPVHRAIYQNTQAKAIVHAHPPHLTALSMVDRVIKSEHLENFGSIAVVPVLGWDMEVKPGGLADIIAETLKTNYIIAVRGHGSFAIGQIMDEAYDYTTNLEAACQILCLLKSMRVSG